MISTYKCVCSVLSFYVCRHEPAMHVHVHVCIYWLVLSPKGAFFIVIFPLCLYPFIKQTGTLAPLYLFSQWSEKLHCLHSRGQKDADKGMGRERGNEKQGEQWRGQRTQGIMLQWTLEVCEEVMEGRWWDWEGATRVKVGWSHPIKLCLL